MCETRPNEKPAQTQNVSKTAKQSLRVLSAVVLMLASTAAVCAPNNGNSEPEVGDGVESAMVVVDGRKLFPVRGVVSTLRLAGPKKSILEFYRLLMMKI